MLTSTYAEVLSVLDESAGRTTGGISRLALFSYGSDNARQRSAAVRVWLIDMMKQGLVSTLDNQKPVCWVRTRAGTSALNTYSKR